MICTVTIKPIPGTIFTTETTFIYISGIASHIIFITDDVTYIETIIGYVSVDDLRDSVGHSYPTHNSYFIPEQLKCSQ